MFDLKRKKLFDSAYDEYIKIEEIVNECETGCFSSDAILGSTSDYMREFDMYLQGILLSIAMADGSISEDELSFILDLPDNFDDICRRNKGYRRTIQQLNAENYSSFKQEFFKDDHGILQLCELIKEQDDDADTKILQVITSVENIGNCLIAIDDVIDERENACLTDIIRHLKEILKIKENKKTFQTMESASSELQEQSEGLGEALDELNSLIGLDTVKGEVLSCINLIKVNNIRKIKGMPELQISKHMVFTGHPGTGKTTVARIIAKIYKELGVVSKGHLVETDRAGLVAGYVGQTALKTAQVIRRAKGGVLFIDEAYSLSSKEGSNDFGKEAIDQLVKGMEDNRDDLVVIAAGYVNEMKSFINMNPGLRSRFNKYIDFKDYSSEEMIEIYLAMCDKMQLILTDEAKKKARRYFDRMTGDAQFGNARGVRNYFEQTIANQANRIAMLNDPDDKTFRTITEEDEA